MDFVVCAVTCKRCKCHLSILFFIFLQVFFFFFSSWFGEISPVFVVCGRVCMLARVSSFLVGGHDGRNGARDASNFLREYREPLSPCARISSVFFLQYRGDTFGFLKYIIRHGILRVFFFSRASLTLNA